MKKEKTKASILTAGLIKENPVLVLLLGTCPSLAVTATVPSALGMGVTTLLVLIFSNLMISLVRGVIPSKARIPCYIVIVAGLVTVVQMLVKAFAPDIDKALGIYLPLIAVNCIILGRAEMFASKNKVVNSILDGIGMGLGFTLALLLIGSVREIIGSGTWFGITLTKNLFSPTLYFMLPPGGFFVFGIIIAAINRITKGKATKKAEIGCGACSNCAVAKEEGS